MVVDTREPQVLNPAGGAVLREIQLMRADLRAALRQMIAAAEGQSEDMFFLPLLTTQRIQGSEIIVFPNGNGPYTVQLGAWNAIAFETTGSGKITINFPRVIEAGTRLTLLTAAGVEIIPGPGSADIYSAYLIGTSEAPALYNGEGGDNVSV